MQTPLWEQAKAAIDAGRPDDAKALIDRAVTQWAGLKDYSINWITSLLTFIADELGEEAVERALRKTGDEFVRPRRDTGTAWGDLPAVGTGQGDRPLDAREHGRGRGGRGRREDHAVVPVRQRRQADRRRALRGRAPVRDAARAGGPHVLRDELWVYCAHCSVNNEIQPVEWGEAPTSIEFPPTRAGEPCVHHVYKDVAAIPAEAYRRIGRNPPSG